MKASTTGAMVYLVIILAMICGWIMNIYDLVANSPELAAWGGMEVARVIGVFIFPLGSVLGYF